MMPATPGQDEAPQGPAADSVSFDAFSGLRNTVDPERLGPRELARAQNIDLDDAGQVHLRRGQTLVAQGSWHSLYGCQWFGTSFTFGVNAGVLCALVPSPANYVMAVPLLGGMSQDHLSWECVGPIAYFSSLTVSGQIDLATLTVTPWASRSDHSYYPPIAPTTGSDFWLSPVTEPEDGMYPVAGRLLGPVPFAEHIAYFQGRMYLAVENVLWATELYLYNYVDKTANHRQFEDKITGIACVDDGLYVGTKSGLFFLSGIFKEQRRTLKERSGVIPGTMIQVPGEISDPEGRQRPDVPRESSIAISCMTTDGLVIGMKGGTTYNVTRSQFKFPVAVEGVSAFRSQDGTNSIISVLNSGGSPTIPDAAFGDYVSVQHLRNGQTIGETTSGPPVAPKPPVQPPADTVTFQGVDGSNIVTVPED